MTDVEGPVPLSTAAPADNMTDAKVAFLRQPASYPDASASIEVVETHMSWVFLTDRFVYKLKKPIRLLFLDFSSVERRKHFCEEEVRLNRRLAPGVYLGTVAMTWEAGSALSLGGSGPVIDWLVKMRRLPSDRTLDRAIRQGTVTDQNVELLGRKLAEFYRTATPIKVTPTEYRTRFEGNVAGNLGALREAAGILPLQDVERVHQVQFALLHRTPSPIEQRAAEGRIVEAHGDLRPEHVFLGSDPQIIDCLEFNLDFRCLDPVDELGFLAMECEMLGAPAIGAALLEWYRNVSGDRPPQPVLDLYKCYRACLRSKLAFWHLRDHSVREPARWPKQALAYLNLAALYADRLESH